MGGDRANFSVIPFAKLLASLSLSPGDPCLWVFIDTRFIAEHVTYRLKSRRKCSSQFTWLGRF